ncbi:MAG: tetratricopeptide repeat protein [Prevotella sp.]|nr:tetratricopeptide repeat protein [Prevotella sp.]
MRKNLILFASAVGLMAMTSCSGKLGALSADNFNVVPNPLESEAGQVPTTINGKFPEKYMKKKAVVSVVPELRTSTGEVFRGQPATFQGEKVQGNDQTISYKVGGNYTMQSNFNYVPSMQQSDLWLTFDARVGKKSVSVPAVKVASGVIATSELYKQLLTSTGACIAPDSFKQIVAHRQEAQVKFLVNQANLRQSELKNNSVQEFVNLLKKINRESEKLALQNVEVLGYASPEGSFDFNDRLANRRQDVAADYVDKQLRQNKLSSEIDTRYTAEDWDGFQQLVQASNIQDKDVILRVLSMYKDPEERERQIRNMSAGYRELADGILPELRRSRLIINYNVIGRTNEQIQEQYAADPSVLNNEELLYAATLTDDNAQKEQIYKTTASLFPADYRALNNIAALAFNRGDNATAQDYLARALRVTSNAPEANANLGLLALQSGDVAKAENLIAKAVGANGLYDVLGSLNIAKGNYAQAASNLKNSFNNTAALAEILNKNYASAEVILNGIKNKDAMTSYLQAINAARQGNTAPAAQFLQQALQKDPSLATYAAKDLELRNVSK